MNEQTKHRLVGGGVLALALAALLPLLGEPRRVPLPPPAVPGTLERTPVLAPRAMSAPPTVVSPPAQRTPAEAAPAPANHTAPRPPVVAGRNSMSPPPRAGASGWAVQLASFSEASNAAALRDRLVGDGYDAVVVSSSDGTLHRLFVGSFQARGEAEQLIAALAAATGLKGVVRRLGDG